MRTERAGKGKQKVRKFPTGSLPPILQNLNVFNPCFSETSLLSGLFQHRWWSLTRLKMAPYIMKHASVAKHCALSGSGMSQRKSKFMCQMRPVHLYNRTQKKHCFCRGSGIRIGSLWRKSEYQKPHLQKYLLYIYKQPVPCPLNLP